VFALSFLSFRCIFTSGGYFCGCSVFPSM
jgi:hypothetical protein